VPNANIKQAAAFLRQAAADLQNEINNIRRSIEESRRGTDQTVVNLESQIRTLDLATGDNKLDQNTRAAMILKDRDLRKDKDQKREQTARFVSEQEKRLKDTESQMVNLQGIAKQLDFWPG
jgi:hypothetical protein